jgi:hypothetical protein
VENQILILKNLFDKIISMSTKDLLNSFDEEDFANKKVNLHIHTTFSDGEADAFDIVKQAKEKGYKKIAICDHNTINAHKIVKDDILLTAVEFDVWCGYVFLHLLAYGIDVNNAELQSFCAKSKKETELDIIRFFSTRDTKKLIQAIHNAGGVAVLAHPACCWALSLDKFVKKLVTLGLDGIEVYYPYPRWRKYIRFSHPEQVEKIADKYNLIKTGGTDLHGKTLD